MTVDRQQIRRDAEATLNPSLSTFPDDGVWQAHLRARVINEPERVVARHCLALLTELEETEIRSNRLEIALNQIANLAERQPPDPPDILARHARAALA